MIPFTVLGGYLGAGKTTLINHLLRSETGARVALLINDFGAINIDAALIESQTDKQINLANGCICCSLSDGFFEAVENLKDMQPDHIVVEASGVADVHKLAQYGHGHGLQLDGVIVVVDAETIRAKAHDKYVGQTVLRQLKAADLIVLNKIDLVPELDTVQAWLVQTSGAPVLPCERCEVPVGALFGIAGHHADESPAAEHPHYASWHFTSEEAYQKRNVAAFMSALGDEVVRAKGIITCTDGTTLELQVVGHRRTLSARSGSPSVDRATQLVAIGLARNFSPSRLDELAAEHLATS